MLELNHCKHIPSYVSRLVLYITPEGTISLVIGNQRLTVNAEEARGLVEQQFMVARTFAAMNGESEQAK